MDGLRLDATQQIFDSSPEHIIRVLSCAARQAAIAPASSSPSGRQKIQKPRSSRGNEALKSQRTSEKRIDQSLVTSAATISLKPSTLEPRSIFLVAENEAQQTILARTLDQGGYGLDALWNDDFHHSAMVALTGRAEAYYSDYRGTPQEFISALKWGFLYQGQWYSWQKKYRGSPSFGLHPQQFVIFLQNHDQVANSLRGFRIRHLTSPGRLRAMTALLLLAPGTPMLFQGQEFGASTPFLFFADHNPDLAKLVARGRKEFLSQFSSVAAVEKEFSQAKATGQVLPPDCLSDPCSEETFSRCKLDFSERAKHGAIYRLHKDLLQLRRNDPVFSSPRPGGLDGAVLGPEAFVLRFFGAGTASSPRQNGQDRLLLVNLGPALHLSSAPEPLLAPLVGTKWTLLWSSEHPFYGGSGTPTFGAAEHYLLPGQAAVVLATTPMD
ncbi:MAG: hypothetical protein C5B50_11520 [Verrucomicrobia bacterium]|nr:MAG: hypothetical protein C5B50_11520 [Verrucomicrobiota bacterium]